MIEKDVKEVIGHFEKAADLRNVHVQYIIGKIYPDSEGNHENAERVIFGLTKLAGNSNALAQYAFGKLYVHAFSRMVSNILLIISARMELWIIGFT